MLRTGGGSNDFDGRLSPRLSSSTQPASTADRAGTAVLSPEYGWIHFRKPAPRGRLDSSCRYFHHAFRILPSWDSSSRLIEMP